MSSPASKRARHMHSNGGDTAAAAAAVDRRQTRYDRQLRLWGDHGQSALEAAHVALVRATAVGTEVLKNIVLPGVGAFTIFDDSLVTPMAVGSDFFCQPQHVGRKRAEVACQLLQEMNGDVRGHWSDTSVASLLADPSPLIDFTCVIVVGVSVQHAAHMEHTLWQHNIPIVLCGSSGMVGWGRISVGEHCIVESRPDNTFDDLRIDAPFPQLQELCDSVDLDSMSRERHSHVPYVLLILKAVQRWREQVGGKESLPRSYEDKRAVRAILHSMRRLDDYGNVEQENFAEAVNNLNRVLRVTEVPPAVAAIFADASCDNVAKSSGRFWLVARALRDYVHAEGGGRLPVNGSLPDMVADTESYVALQQVYKRRAEHDAQCVERHYRTLVERIGSASAVNCVCDDWLIGYCKHAAHMRVYRSRRLCEPPDAGRMQTLLADGDTAALWMCALRAVQRFEAAARRYPTAPDDLDALRNELHTLLRVDWKLDVSAVPLDRVPLSELCRYGGAELHAAAALLGAIMGHEVIKLVTAQFVPVDGTIVVDANTMRADPVQL